MVRPAQKLTTVPVSTVDIGDKISVDFDHDKGVYVTRVGVVHKFDVDGNSRFLRTQEGGTICAWRHGDGPEPRVFMIERAPKVHSTLELFDAL